MKLPGFEVKLFNKSTYSAWRCSGSPTCTLFGYLYEVYFFWAYLLTKTTGFLSFGRKFPSLYFVERRVKSLKFLLLVLSNLAPLLVSVDTSSNILIGPGILSAKFNNLGSI